MITKLLCKYLDLGNKGYVTAGDLIAAGTIAGIAVLLLASAVQGAIIIHAVGAVGAINTEFQSPIDPACVLIFLLVAGIVVYVVGYTLLVLILHTLDDIWETKIATCERKEGDDE